MSNNGDEKDPLLSDAEKQGDLIAKAYKELRLQYDMKQKIAIGNDYKDDLIEAQEIFLAALANTVDQYQKRFGDIDVLEKVQEPEEPDDVTS